MIKINLLPPEYRKVDGTPIARLAVTIAGVFLVACTAGAWGYVHMGMLAQVRKEREDKEEELVALKHQADRSQDLLKEYKEYQRRRETIEKIGASRLLWSRKLDELADVIHNKGDQKRHLVWLSSIRTQSSRRPADSPMQLVIKGWSGGEHLRRLSDFNNDIKHSEFFEDCITVDPPEGRRVNLDQDFVPNQGWEFSFGIDLKQPTWREKQ